MFVFSGDYLCYSHYIEEMGPFTGHYGREVTLLLS